MSELNSRQVGSYQLTRVLERGSFVESYLGEHVRTGSVVWSPDSRLIASIGDDNFIHIWDTTTATRLFIHPADERDSCLTWKADSKRIASSNGTVDNDGLTSFHVWDAANGADDVTYGRPPAPATATDDPIITSTHGISFQGAQSVTWSPNGQLIAALDGDMIYIWKGGH
ncbi:MAG: WD40 repeat domain-containing protein [Ktedonobacteraceae bacterium]